MEKRFVCHCTCDSFEEVFFMKKKKDGQAVVLGWVGGQIKARLFVHEVGHDEFAVDKGDQ